MEEQFVAMRQTKCVYNMSYHKNCIQMNETLLTAPQCVSVFCLFNRNILNFICGEINNTGNNQCMNYKPHLAEMSNFWLGIEQNHIDQRLTFILSFKNTHTQKTISVDVQNL